MHEELTKKLDILEAFLCGEETMFGFWFSERPAGMGAFWWRKHLRKDFADIRRALTAPQAETCERDASTAPKTSSVYGFCPVCGASGVARERRPNGNDKCANGHTYPSRDATKGPWTRKDGSTTPRGDVVDRRKSAEGNAGAASARIGGCWRNTPAQRYGRRSGDRARWTAPVQETPQTLVQWFDANNVNMTLRKLCAELDRRSAMK